MAADFKTIADFRKDNGKGICNACKRFVGLCRVGGLAGTVVASTPENLVERRANGFVFDEFSAQDFDRALRRAFARYARAEDWAAVVRGALQQSFRWSPARPSNWRCTDRSPEAFPRGPH